MPVRSVEDINRNDQISDNIDIIKTDIIDKVDEKENQPAREIVLPQQGLSGIILFKRQVSRYSKIISLVYQLIFGFALHFYSLNPC